MAESVEWQTRRNVDREGKKINELAEGHSTPFLGEGLLPPPPQGVWLHSSLTKIPMQYPPQGGIFTWYAY